MLRRLKEFGERIHQIYGNNLRLHGKFATDTAAALDGDANTYWQAPASSPGNNAPPMLTVQFAQADNLRSHRHHGAAQ